MQLVKMWLSLGVLATPWVLLSMWVSNVQTVYGSPWGALAYAVYFALWGLSFKFYQTRFMKNIFKILYKWLDK